MIRQDDFEALATVCRGLAQSTRERETRAMFVEMSAEYERLARAKAATERAVESMRKAA